MHIRIHGGVYFVSIDYTNHPQGSLLITHAFQGAHTLGPCGPGPCWRSWVLVNRDFVPWAVAGRALVGPLGSCVPGPFGPCPCGLGPCGRGPCGPPSAIMGRLPMGLAKMYVYI